MDKEPINIIWKSYHEPEIIARGYWDQGLLEDIFKQLDVKHHTDFDWVQNDSVELPEEKVGAVVIINGRTHIEDVEQINADIAKLKWVLFVDTGDEESSFPWSEIKHPMMKFWVMLPRMNVHNDAHLKLPNGYRPQTRKALKKCGQQLRDIDWSFVGQVNHERRQQCFDVLTQFKPHYPSSVLVGTDGFGKEDVKYDEYMEIMARSKIVLCPSGIESPDNFRLYEALEAGALPVVDAFSTNFKTPGFWKYLLGNDVPFPIIDYWDALPDMLPWLIRDHQTMSNKCFAWWQLKKREIRLRLVDDVKELNR